MQTNVLEMRLGQLLGKAQRLRTEQLMPAGGLLGDGRTWSDKSEVIAFWQSLESLDAELRRVLRQFDGLERDLWRMEAQLAAVPVGERWREQSRIASLENDLSRVARLAARLAALLLELRQRGGGISGADLAQAIQQIGTEMGKALDSINVLRTVQQVTTQPAIVPAGAARPGWGGVVETAFIVIAMVAALAKKRSGRDT